MLAIIRKGLLTVRVQLDRKQVMAVAVLCGALAGFVGFLPLLFGLRQTRKVTATSNFGHMSILLISLIISFVLMFVFAIICVNVARDVAMPFVLAEALALSVTAIVFGVRRTLAGKSEKE